VLKLDSSGAYQWHTFYGSGSYDYGYGIATDGSGNFYITGESEAGWNGPAGQSPLHAYSGGFSDIFVLKLNVNGAYQWHTFYGSSGADYGHGIRADARGNVYIAGESNAAWNGPAGQNPLHAYSGGYDIFMLKLNGSGVYQWHTFYGSSGSDYGYAMTTDGSGNFYVTGLSSATWNGPAGQSPLHAHSSPAHYDLFVLKLSDAPSSCDFNGDGKTDIAFYRSSTGVWWVTPSSGAPAYGYGWGGPGFKPVPGDYDKDGKTDIAIYDTTGGAWWIIPSSGIPAYGVGWGGSGFKPVPGDYDGDGKTDIAIYDTTGGAWWVIPSSGIGPQGQVGAYGVGWGGSAFKPVHGDYDGDGKTDIAIYNTSSGAWWVIPSSGVGPQGQVGAYGVGWGGSVFTPVRGDYDGDGKTDIAIYNTSSGAWWIIPSSGVGPQGQVGAYGVGWGGPGFKPVPGDYDGDKKTDVAIYQTSNGGWWIIYSSDGSTYGMGWGGDISDIPLSTNPD
jgi:hypothetical protein